MSRLIRLGPRGSLGLSPGYLAQLAPGYLAALGYTELCAFDWATHADTAAVLAALSPGSSSGSNVPRGAYITKVNDDPVLPNRMFESLSPYNDDHAGAVASAGRQFKKDFTVPGGVTHIWGEQFLRMGGTLHPTRPQPTDYSHVGTYPVGDADSVKLFYFETNVAGNRVGGQFTGPTNILVDFGYGQIGTSMVATEALLLEAGYGSWSNNASVSFMFDGRHLYRRVWEFWRVSDDLMIFRRWQQQMTDNTGAWNPQPPLFRGNVATRSSGAIMAQATIVRWHDNKNRTSKDDGVSSTSWDVEDLFASTSADTGTLRAENLKPFRGNTRVYCGPFRAVYGGDNKPLTDYLGRNLDEYGRADADWPAGV